MKRNVSIMAAVAAVAALCMPLTLPANTEPSTWWIDDIEGAITFYMEGGHYKKDYPDANWSLYLKQIQVVRSTFQKGDAHGTYRAMNRFMDMLEAREGGIPLQAAHELFNFCNLVTPPALHDAGRHAGPPRIEQPRIPVRAPEPLG